MALPAQLHVTPRPASTGAVAEIVDTVQTIVEDYQLGNDDWVYVGLLTMRHQMNQQALFSGDVSMRGLMMQLWAPYLLWFSFSIEYSDEKSRY
jgi:hypothetical protein